MRNRAIPGALAALSILAAACGGGDSPTQPRVDPVVGTYRLTTVNEAALPFTFRPDSLLDPGTGDTLTFTSTWFRDIYEVRANGRVENPFIVRVIITETGAPAERDSIEATLLGRWDKTATSLRFIYDSALFEGSRFPLQEPDTQFVPLPTATGWTQTLTVPHYSLGGPDVVREYRFVYVKQ